ncbi:MAG: hypothetical protein P1P86_14160 [Bacteroidales bacterium]|nr:hypothetical protein [Bacteroidales bacterium]
MTNKAHYAVIAGELAPGARVSDAQFSKIPDLIRASFQAVNRLIPGQGKLKYEIIRMDEFLALSESPADSMRSVIMLLSAFRFLSHKELFERLELRICQGIGPVEFARDHLRESDGTAFRKASEGIGKMKRNQRISITSPVKTLNEEFDLTCSFMDILIRSWSEEQAEALFLNLTGKNQLEISQLLGISQPAVNRRLKAGHSDLVHKFIHRFENLLKTESQI